MPIKIKDLVDEMQMQFDEYKMYLNKETCEIVTASTENLSIAEESEEADDFLQYPDWQREAIRDALDIILNWNKYVELPDKWEINEYSIMERFCSSIENDRISDALFTAIRGRGAFRRFKDTLYRYGIEQDWYSFYEKALKEIAIDWCQHNNIDYIK
ncbi:UPF0158 family protein [Lutispora saccharofermentans]|uniref:UPF0158 family protein n=1 Tax=Lutispora saccharofermentans TaxID=3024236 RepID=A0ABT1NEN1_9FIRM|nr:UPF0158 family protein [Lutispora saccharofermentans]MCQ1528301.1 UPF0158 family protein [Lutispora saccharofermentans]